MILFSDYQGKVLVFLLFALFSYLLNMYMYIIMTLLWRINKIKIKLVKSAIFMTDAACQFDKSTCKGYFHQSYIL